LWNFGMGMDGFRVYQLLIVIGYYGWTTMEWCSFFIWSHILRNVHQLLVFFILNSSCILIATRKYATNSLSLSLIL
jgi:hypothetical protein